MRTSSVAIGLIWMYLLIDSYVQGRALPSLLDGLSLPAIPDQVMWAIVTTPFLVCFGFTFWQRKALAEEMPLITKWVDGRYGRGTFKDFNRRLKPVAASAISSFILAAAGTYETASTTGHSAGYLISLVFCSVGGGLLSAYLLSRKYPPMLQ